MKVLFLDSNLSKSLSDWLVLISEGVIYAGLRGMESIKRLGYPNWRN